MAVHAQRRALLITVDLVDTYRSLAWAAPSYSLLANYNEKVGAPASEKKYAAQVAQEAYHATIAAAERTIGLLCIPTVAHALADLLPLRSQHRSSNNTRYVFWPRRIDDYQHQPTKKKVEAEEGEIDGAVSENEEQAEEQVNGGWGTPASYDPWGTTPDLVVDSDTTSTLDSLSEPSTPDTDTSSIYSVDSIPPLPNPDELELRSVDEVSEDEPTEAGLTISPSPPSPPPNDKGNEVIKDEGFHILVPQLCRGHDDNRLMVITGERVYVLHENRFPFPIPILESRYRLRYPNATPRTVQRATILIDEIFARIRNYPVESLRNNLLEYLPYRQAVIMEHQERVLWDQLGLYTDLRLLDEVMQHITPQEADDCRNILQS